MSFDFNPTTGKLDLNTKSKPVISKTYAELETMIAGNLLVVGQQYSWPIQTCYSQINTDVLKVGIYNYNTLTPEQLVLATEYVIGTADSTCCFEPIVKSLKYEGHDLTYDFTDNVVPVNAYTDTNYYFTGSVVSYNGLYYIGLQNIGQFLYPDVEPTYWELFDVANLARPGYVSRRHDKVNNVSAPIDYKNIKSARFRAGYDNVTIGAYGADDYSSLLTAGLTYEIIAYDGLTVDFTTDGAADNNVGTIFISLGTATMDAGNGVKQILPKTMWSLYSTAVGQDIYICYKDNLDTDFSNDAHFKVVWGKTWYSSYLIGGYCLNRSFSQWLPSESARFSIRFDAYKEFFPFSRVSGTLQTTIQDYSSIGTNIHDVFIDGTQTNLSTVDFVVMDKMYNCNIGKIYTTTITGYLIDSDIKLMVDSTMCYLETTNANSLQQIFSIPYWSANSFKQILGMYMFGDNSVADNTQIAGTFNNNVINNNLNNNIFKGATDTNFFLGEYNRNNELGPTHTNNNWYGSFEGNTTGYYCDGNTFNQDMRRMIVGTDFRNNLGYGTTQISDCVFGSGVESNIFYGFVHTNLPSDITGQTFYDGIDENRNMFISPDGMLWNDKVSNDGSHVTDPLFSYHLQDGDYYQLQNGDYYQLN